MAAAKYKPKLADVRQVEVDSWTLRCLYRRSGYARQIRSGRMKELGRHQPKTLPTDRSYSVQAYYGYPEDGISRVRLQWHVNPDGSIGASGKKDVKQIYIQGHEADYHLYGGGDPEDFLRKEPERRFKRVWLKRLYGHWRNFGCVVWGAAEAHRNRRALVALTL